MQPAGLALTQNSQRRSLRLRGNMDSSWRALKAEIDRRHGGGAAAFFEACEKGDVGILSNLLAKDPTLIRAEKDPCRKSRCGLRQLNWIAHGLASRPRRSCNIAPGSRS
jgi:hypothetical protein